MAKGTDESTFVVWLDNALLLLGGFVLMSAILLTTVSKPVETEDPGQELPGQIAVTITWETGIDADVDLWLRSPVGDRVGYSNLSGIAWNLLRDDLGSPKDMGGLNFENAYTRGIPAGEYVVNLHAYRAHASLYPLKVMVEIIIAKNPKAGKGGHRKLNAEAVLYHTGEEVTALRFEIDGNGNLIEESVHDLYSPIVKGG